MRQHHTSQNGPKWDHPAYDDEPYPVYPGASQGRGGYYGPQLQPGYPARIGFLWKLKVMMWLVILLVSAYCVYYLLPCGHLAVLGITLHP